MTKKPKQHQPLNIIYIISGVLAALIVINMIFIFLLTNQVKTIHLLRSEQELLERDKRIIAASEEIKKKYQSEISIISNAFPNEMTFPLFLESLESLMRSYSDGENIRFTSVSPIPEQDRQFLLLSLSMNTDVVRMHEFLIKLEKLPYLTHITGIMVKSPGGFRAVSEYSIALKVYVQNPFVAR